jgi:hypothetical protein
VKSIIVLLGLIAIVLISISAFAADDTLPNDPNVNPDANACFAGGVWAGKCGDSGYLWEGGWYLIRYFYGLIPRSQFPDQYKWALPSLEEEEEEAAAAIATCYIEVGAGLYENVPPSVLNGGSGGSFRWYTPTFLISDYTTWAIWGAGSGWYTGHYGDCSPLGIAAPLPPGTTIVTWP